MTLGSTTEFELRSQPDVWRRLDNRLRQGPVLPGLDVGDVDELIFFGSGSSFYLAEALARAAARVLAVHARAVPSCELVLVPDEVLAVEARRLAIGISRSGESTEMVVASEHLQSRSVPVVAMTCRPGTPWALSMNAQLPAPEGAEDGLVMLRSFTSMLLAGESFLASHSHVDGPPVPAMVDAAERLLTREWDAIASFVRQGAFSHHVVLGSGATYPIAREAALKLQEMAITTCEAYHALEYRHGPKSTAGTGSLVVLLAIEDGAGFEEDLIRDLRTQGATTFVVGDGVERFADVAEKVLDVNTDLPAHRQLPVLLLPCQILAIETARSRGRDPDAPPNLTSVVRLP